MKYFFRNRAHQKEGIQKDTHHTHPRIAKRPSAGALRPVRHRHILTRILTHMLTTDLTIMSFHFRDMLFSLAKHSHIGDRSGDYLGEYSGEYLIFSTPLSIGLSALSGEYGEGSYKLATKNSF